jgi:hypothetical protein
MQAAAPQSDHLSCAAPISDDAPPISAPRVVHSLAPGAGGSEGPVLPPVVVAAKVVPAAGGPTTAMAPSIGAVPRQRASRFHNAFDKWCSDNHIVLPKAAKSNECTHYTMDGFKLNIPWRVHDEFLIMYARAVFVDRHDLFFIEKKENLELEDPGNDSVYKFHCDWDFVQLDAVTSEFAVDMLSAFLKVIKAFYPSKSSLTATLMQAPPKPCLGSDGSTPCVKTGVHVVVDNLFVRRAEALTLRAACVTEYRARYGERAAPGNSIEAMFDHCIYMANGLRMAGSKKMVKCSACTRNREPCFVCKGPRRMVMEDRAYIPTHVVTVSSVNGASPEVVVQPIDMALISASASGAAEGGAAGGVGGGVDLSAIARMCSIRTPLRECDVMVRPPGAPVPALTNPLPGSMQKPGAKYDMRYSGAVFKSDSMGLSRYPHDVEPKTEAFCEILAFVRKVSLVYSAIELVSVKSNSDRTRYVCRTRGWGSSYCMNVGRDHTSNTIYFQLDYKKGLSQRCFSNKDCPPGCIKTCRTYESPAVPIPEMLRAALFPAIEPAVKALMPRPRAPASTSGGARAAAAAPRPYAIGSPSSSLGDAPTSSSVDGGGGGAGASAGVSGGAAGLAASGSSGSGAVTASASGSLARKLDSMSMMELVKAQREADGKAGIKSKRMREEITGTPATALKTAMPNVKRAKQAAGGSSLAGATPPSTSAAAPSAPPFIALDT